MAWDSGDLYEGSGTLKTQCSASSEYSATYPATKAFDGATGTDADDCWISTAANTPSADGSCYVDFDFGVRRLTMGIQLRRRDAAGDCRNFPSSIRILSSKTGLFSGEETDCGTYDVDSPDDGAWSGEIDFTTGAAQRYLRIEIRDMWERYTSTPQDYVCIKEIRFRSWETLSDVETILPDFHSTFVQEVSGTEGDYGYIGQTYESRLVTYFREHAYTSGTTEVTFDQDSSGNLTIASSAASKAYGWAFCVLNRADIDGWTIRFVAENLESYDVNNQIQCLIYDGAYTASSSTDFPMDAVMPTKGNGLLQTVYMHSSGGTPDVEETIDVSGGSETYCTLFFGLYDSSNIVARSIRIQTVALLSHPTGIEAAEGFCPVPFGELNLKEPLELEGFCPVPDGDMAFASGSMVMEGFCPLPVQQEAEAHFEGFCPSPEIEMRIAGRIELEGFCPVPEIEMRGGSRLEGFCPTPKIEARVEAVEDARMEGYCPIPTIEMRGGSRMEGFCPTPEIEALIIAEEEARMEGFCPSPEIEMRVEAADDARLEGFCPTPFGFLRLKGALSLEGFCPMPTGSLQLAASGSCRLDGFCPMPSGDLLLEGIAGDMELEGFGPMPFGALSLAASTSGTGPVYPVFGSDLLIHRRGV